jgi:hypothetical protein
MSSRITFKGTYEEIEALASELRRLVLERMDGDKTRARTILEWVVDRLGGKLRVAEDPSKLEKESGSLAIYGKGRFDIFLSPF